MTWPYARCAAVLPPTRRAPASPASSPWPISTWGLPSESAAHIVAELASNATVHGRATGRDFELHLAVHTDSRLRIEVIDTRGDHLPAPSAPDPLAEGGRGLLVVEALTDRWGVTPGPVPRKTVWAELDLVL